MARLVLIRGLPGSGKSTKAKTEYQGYVHLEADQFLRDKRGNYCYDAERLPLAHSLCILKCRCVLQRGESVVVSNTFISHPELRPYFDMAAELDVSVEVVVATGNFENVHDVPAERIQKMRERRQP